MNNKLRIAVVFVVSVGFIWMMMWGVGQSNREHLTKINQQLEEINSMSPEQYCDKIKRDLLKRKEMKDEMAKDYEKGTTYVIYVGIVRGAPNLAKALMENWYK